MTIQLVRRREMPVPTLWGWAVMLGLSVALVLTWLLGAESFLATTHRENADVLVVEAWIGYDGFVAAQREYTQGHYKYLVAAGGLSNSPWDTTRWNFADASHDFFVREGVPASAVIAAFQTETEVQRTHATAVAAWRALDAHGIRPSSINVFTLGPHARRSRLIFAKVFAPTCKVGVVSWTPPRRLAGPWWHSSVRADDLIKETVGYFFELLFNSGRTSNAPDPAPSTGAR